MILAISCGLATHGQGDVKSEHRHFRNQQNGLEWANLIQMTIVSTTMGKNPLEEME